MKSDHFNLGLEKKKLSLVILTYLIRNIGNKQS